MFYFHIIKICEKKIVLFKSIDIGNAFKPKNVMKYMLCKFKPKIPPLQNACVVYNISCKDCDSLYIGE